MSSVAPVGRMLRRTAGLSCPFLKLSSHLPSLGWNAGQASPPSDFLLSVMQWFMIIRTMRLSVFLHLILSYCLTISLSHSQFSPFDFLNNLFKPPRVWTTTRQQKELKSPVTRENISFRPHPTVSPTFIALQVFYLSLFQFFVSLFFLERQKCIEKSISENIYAWSSQCSVSD